MADTERGDRAATLGSRPAASGAGVRWASQRALLTRRPGRDARPLPNRVERRDGATVPPPIVEADPAEAVRARDAYFKRSLVLADLTATMAALLIASLPPTVAPPSLQTLLILPLAIALLKLAGLYERDHLVINRAITLDEIPTLFNVATVLALLIAVGGTLFLSAPFSELPLLLLWLALCAFLGLFRAAARAFAMRHTAIERCVVIGDAEAYARIAERFTHNPHVNSEVLGYVPISRRIRSDDPPPLGRLTDLDEVVRSVHAHRVIIAPRDSDPEAPLDVVRRAKALGIKVSVVPRILEVVGSSAEFDQVDGLTILGVQRFGLVRSSQIVKRCFDLALALALLIVAAPILAVMAIAIKLDSPGPVFFRQLRMGRCNCAFEILKLRTMVVDADARKEGIRAENETHGVFKIANDPRITRVGRWLRRTSLDELPQLINVLRGEMSIVGPRPLVLEEDRQIEGWYRRRLDLKPGVTGPWQILASGRVPLYEMVKIDYLYAATWTLWSDMKILIRTVPYMLARRGA